MTDQERAALIAWLDERMRRAQVAIGVADENHDVRESDYKEGQHDAYEIVKIYLSAKSEAAHDEA